jgi:hypothetical protein
MGKEKKETQKKTKQGGREVRERKRNNMKWNQNQRETEEANKRRNK